MPPPKPIEELLDVLGVPPGRHVAPDGATLDMIRQTIKTLTTETPVPARCLPLQAEYTKKLQAANNAVRGGGDPSNFGLIWNNFIKAAPGIRQMPEGPAGHSLTSRSASPRGRRIRSTSASTRASVPRMLNMSNAWRTPREAAATKPVRPKAPSTAPA